MGLSAAVLTLAGHRPERLADKLRKFPVVRTMLDFLAGADARLVRSPRMLTGTIALQLGIVLLDAATVSGENGTKLSVLAASTRRPRSSAARRKPMSMGFLRLASDGDRLECRWLV